MPVRTTTPAPPSPPNPPSDWSSVVRGNMYTNLERLGRWTGKTTVVPRGQDPYTKFTSVNPGSLKKGTTIYVVTHGWAPGYRDIVNASGGRLLWWSPQAKSSDGYWASDWAWSPIPPVNQLQINSMGLLQSIVAQDPNAVVLAYSWIDDSATDTPYYDYTEVYASEAHTHINGLRLANALLEAIDPSFWSTGLIRLIGHSHGSKVATVAALTLQQSGRHVEHLTLLDSPERLVEPDQPTHKANGANLLGYYLERMVIRDPLNPGAGAFVDNYASCFGVSYDGKANLKNIVEVSLDPTVLYGSFDYGDQHTYAAAWYGGAAAGAASCNQPKIGLAWPPPPQPYRPALVQSWTMPDRCKQWLLIARTATYPTYYFYEQSLAVTTVATLGNVHGDPSTQLIFGANQKAYSIYRGTYDNLANNTFGLAIDFQWINPQVGDYLVVVMESPITGSDEVLLVMDGQSLPAGRTSVAITSVSNGQSLDLKIYFIAPNPTVPRDEVILSNFRLIRLGWFGGAQQTLAGEPTRAVLTAPTSPLLPLPTGDEGQPERAKASSRRLPPGRKGGGSKSSKPGR